MLREIRVIVIEKILTIRERIASTIRALPDFNLNYQTGSVEEALVQIKGIQPHLVLLDIDMQEFDIGETITRILQLVPTIGIICTAQRWDEMAARLVLKAGAKGYLVKPFTEDELLETVRSLDDPKLLPVSEVIMLYSPKGRCGKTTLAANLAVGLSETTKFPVGLLDANLQFGDLPIFFNSFPTATIVEAVRDLKYLSPVTLGAYLTSYNKYVKVLAAPLKPEQAELVSSKDIMTILAMMRSLFRYVIVDTAPGFDKVSLAAVEAADIVYVVGTFSSGRELDHIRQSLATFRSLGYSQDKIKVVLTRVKNKEMDNLKRMEEELAYPITALLPNEFQTAAAAVNGGTPLVVGKPTSLLATEIMDIVRKIAG